MRRRFRTVTAPIFEALEIVLARPFRSLLASLGTAVSVGVLVTALSLALTAANQVSEEFDAQRATEVTVAVNDESTDESTAFPDDSDTRMLRLNGVEAAGLVRTSEIAVLVGAAAGDEAARIESPLVAMSPGALRAARLGQARGVLDWFGTDSRVVLLGESLAQALETGTDAGYPTHVRLNGSQYTVVGILTESPRFPRLLGQMIVPMATAKAADRGNQKADVRAIATTVPGAARQVSLEIPYALRPDDPSLLAGQAGQDPTQLRQAVAKPIGALVAVLAGISLIGGSIGIAATTLSGVAERKGEIGLRRAVGARRWQIKVGFLTEAVAIGALGSFLGALGAIWAVIGVCLLRGWQAIINPSQLGLAVLAGVSVGLLAGYLPASKAARVPPAEPLRAM